MRHSSQKFQIHLSKCIFDISIWMSQKSKPKNLYSIGPNLALVFKSDFFSISLIQKGVPTFASYQKPKNQTSLFSSLPT